MNGFKTGRLVEPKTKSFNDKVYAETNIVFRLQRKHFWIGIRTKRGSWVYTSSGTEIVFENWQGRSGHNILPKPKPKPKLCAYLISRSNPVGEWATRLCNIKKRFALPFICEFV